VNEKRTRRVVLKDSVLNIKGTETLGPRHQLVFTWVINQRRSMKASRKLGLAIPMLSDGFSRLEVEHCFLEVCKRTDSPFVIR
jgi:hypothetical protein